VTGPEHYLEAERLLDLINTAPTGDCSPAEAERHQRRIISVQVHTGLAQAAAIALARITGDQTMPAADAKAWLDAARTPPGGH
jgi:hypothetical protein